MKDRVTGRNKKLQSFINLFPKGFRHIFNPSRKCVDNFVKETAAKLKQGTKILDAGAGPCPYKDFFSHCNYEATDMIDPYNMMDFVCSLDKIPKKDSTYDAILSTDVLEHVEYPQKVISELYRVLKKGGKLFLTAPQGWKLHQEPYNFYNFTKYALTSMLKQEGFKNIIIKPRGGYFWLLSDTIRFNGILDQYKSKPLIYYPIKIIEFPFTSILIPLILYPLDILDKEKKWTTGYSVEAEK